MALSISSVGERPAAIIVVLLAVADVLSFAFAAITILHWTPAAAGSVSHASLLPSVRL